MEFVNISGEEDSTYFTSDDDGEPYIAVSGGVIHLLNPKPSEFQPEPTAWALAHKNRFSGNFGRYSVAQHAYVVATLVSQMGGTPSQQLAALHHDDAEIATGDQPSPFKAAMRIEAGGVVTAYDVLEDRYNKAIEMRYLIDLDDPLIKTADQIVLGWEIRRLVPPDSRKVFKIPQCDHCPLTGRPIKIGHTMLQPWEPTKAAAYYLDLHEQLEFAINANDVADAIERMDNEHSS